MSDLKRFLAITLISVCNLFFIAGCGKDDDRNRINTVNFYYFDNISDNISVRWHNDNTDSLHEERMTPQGDGWYRTDIDVKNGETLNVTFIVDETKATRYYQRNGSGWFVADGMESDGEVILGTWFDNKPDVGLVSQNLFLGVVAFSGNTRVRNLWNNLNSAKTFIDSLKNDDNNKTALCYAVSRCTQLFNNSGLPAFDRKFVITFAAAADNASSGLYSPDAVVSGEVYNQANKDLTRNGDIISYAIELGANIKESDADKLVVGGQYSQTKNPAELSDVFIKMGDHLIASSKNFILKTNVGNNMSPVATKFFKIEIDAYENFDKTGELYNDWVYAKLAYQGDAVVFSTWINDGDRSKGYVSFDVPIVCGNSSQNMDIALNSLKFIARGKERRIDTPVVKVCGALDGLGTYIENVADSYISAEIASKIAVILVIDCSLSSQNLFDGVKACAKNLIDFLCDSVK